MARTVEDFLSRRIRLLLLDAQAAQEAAFIVASVMAKSLGKDSKWKENELLSFKKLVDKYIIH